MGRGLHQDSKDLIRRAYDVLAEEHPSGVRRVCYAIFGNQAGEWTGKMGGLITRARKDGTIPWDWISDESRPRREPFVVEDHGGLVASMSAVPDFDPWPSQGIRVEAWSEKSVGGTLAPVLDAYLVPFQVHHGFTSTTVLQETARATKRDPRKLVILYVGDHDPTGLFISEADIPKRLLELGASNFEVRRLAIIGKDLKALAEFKDPIKKADTRASWYQKTTGLKDGVELEAMSSNVLRERVEAAVKTCITDVDAWDRIVHTSRVVRESWLAYTKRWRPGVSIPGLLPEYGAGA